MTVIEKLKRFFFLSREPAQVRAALKSEKAARNLIIRRLNGEDEQTAMEFARSVLQEMAKNG